MNILFTCAGRRTYLLKYFKEQLAGQGIIIGADMQLTAPALSVADIKVVVPSVYSEDYVKILLAICCKYSVGLIISLNDLELPILAKNKYLFEEKGIIVLVSSEQVIDICFDKFKTFKYISSIGLKSPDTYVDLEEAITAIKSGQIKFPLIVKPRWGSGSIGIETVYDEEELCTVYALLKKKIRRTILSTVSQTDSNCILIQQEISGTEYGLDIINNLKGEQVTVIVKKKLAMRAGETDKAQIVDNPLVFRIGQTIGSSLRHIGNLDCDVLEEDGKYYILELNPRFGGGFPFSYEAGVNLPKAIIEWSSGQVFAESMLNPKVGKVYAKCDYLVDVTE